MSSFLDAYLLYHSYRTDAPKLYAKIIGCQMLGHVFGYRSVNLIQPDVVRHNIYATLVGKSTISRKDTSQYVGMDIFPKVRCFPNDTPPEQFIVELSENPQSFQWYGELTYMLKGIGKQGYMSRIVEVMNTIFGCPALYTRTLRVKSGQKTEFEVKQPYFSFNATVTDEMLEKFVDKEMMHGGFLARHLLPYEEPNPQPRGRLNSNVDMLQKKLKTILLKISNINGLSGGKFEMTDEALKRYNEMEAYLYKKENILPFVGRYLNYVIAIADILWVSDMLGYYLEGENWGSKKNELNKLNQLNQLNKLNYNFEYKDDITREISNEDNLNNINNQFNSFNRIHITKKYIDRAYQDVIKPCLKYVETLVDYVDIYQPVAALKKIIDKHAPIQHSDAMRYAKLSASEMNNAVQTLMGQEHIFKFTKEVIVRGINKTKKNIYCLASYLDSPRCKNCKWKIDCDAQWN